MHTVELRASVQHILLSEYAVILLWLQRSDVPDPGHVSVLSWLRVYHLSQVKLILNANIPSQQNDSAVEREHATTGQSRVDGHSGSLSSML